MTSNHTSSAPVVSQPVDPAIFAQVQAAASAPENPELPACASSASTLSADRPAVYRKVDYGPVRNQQLKYSFLEGLEKKKNSNCQASHEGTRGNVQGSHDGSGAPPGAQLAPPDGSFGDQVVQGNVVAGEVKAPSCQASHEGTRANVHRLHDKSRAHPGAQLAPPDGSLGDQVVQGSVVAGEVGAPPDATGVVAGASSGSGVAPAVWSESLPHSKHDDGSFDGGDFLFLTPMKKKAPPLP